MDCSLPGSSVLGTLQARILEWVACPPPGDLLDPGIQPMSPVSSALAGGFLTISSTWKEAYTFKASPLLSLVAQLVKNPPAMRETWVGSLSFEDPLEEGMQPTPVLLPVESHGQRTLGGWGGGLWGCKESDTTERLSTPNTTFSDIRSSQALIPPPRTLLNSHPPDPTTSPPATHSLFFIM